MALSAASELHFELYGFLAAMASNLFFAARSVLSTIALRSKGAVSSAAMLYWLLCCGAAALLLPAALTYGEPARLLDPANLRLLFSLLLCGGAHFTYNLLSFQILEQTSPVTHVAPRSSASRGDRSVVTPHQPRSHPAQLGGDCHCLGRCPRLRTGLVKGLQVRLIARRCDHECDKSYSLWSPGCLLCRATAVCSFCYCMRMPHAYDAAWTPAAWNSREALLGRNGDGPLIVSRADSP